MTQTMTQTILNNPTEFPAVREVNMATIGEAAATVAAALCEHGHAFVVLTPDDGTRYELLIAETGDTHTGLFSAAPYRFGSSMGPVAAWMGKPTIHPDYARQNYVADGGMWTATVFALFLNRVAELLDLG